MDRNLAAQLQLRIAGSSPEEIIRYFAEHYAGKVVFSTSFGWEDQVISHMIFAEKLPVKVFTLETGRLFAETYYTWNRTIEIYKQPIHAYYPDKDLLEKMVSEKGPTSFYESVENRKECCGIRKIEPLNRALNGAKVWITGLRSEQSANRNDMDNISFDEQHQLIKVNPIFDWSLDDVKTFIGQNNVPYNPLHDKGFPSIGCQPCTRAVKEGEDFRAGRWWWEDQNKKECGLHS